MTIKGSKISTVLFVNCIAVLATLSIESHALAQPIWEKVDPLPDSAFTAGIVRSGDGVLYAASGYNWVYVSEDNGDTWNRANEFRPNTTIYGMCTDIFNSILLATGNAGILKSSDRGRTWQALSTDCPGGRCLRYFVAANSLGYVYSQKWNEKLVLIRTTNNGDLWTNLNMDHATEYFLLNNDDMYAIEGVGSNGTVMFRSTDYGISWHKYHTFEEYTFFKDMKRDNKGRIVLTSSQDIFISLDNGAGWQSIPHGQKYDFYKIYFQSDSTFFVASNGGRVGNIALYSNDGTMLQDYTSNLPRTAWGDNSFIYAITFDALGRLLVCTYTNGPLHPSPQGIYRTTTPIVTSTYPITSPEEFSLSTAYPNPVASGNAATVEYSLPSSANITLALHNTLGQELRRIEKRMEPGAHTERINTAGLAPGVYYFTLISGAKRSTKMLIVR